MAWQSSSSRWASATRASRRTAKTRELSQPSWMPSITAFARASSSASETPRHQATVDGCRCRVRHRDRDREQRSSGLTAERRAFARVGARCAHAVSAPVRTPLSPRVGA